MVTQHDLEYVFQLKYGGRELLGWGPSQRRKFDYFTPDDIYEAFLYKLVTQETRWLDIGCGRHIFPGNLALAQELATRCRLLVGIDPDDNILQNDLLHEKHQVGIEDFKYHNQFDLVSLRMVAEHIRDPLIALSSIRSVTNKRSLVIVYTVNKWSPVPFLTRILPFSLHLQDKDTVVEN